jgi:hypothetical protein
MNNGIFGLLLLSLFLTACQAREKGMKESEREAIIDSIVGMRVEEVNRQAMEDLDRRMSIDVKAKADSIVLSRQNPVKGKAAPPDNTIPNNLPIP